MSNIYLAIKHKLIKWDTFIVRIASSDMCHERLTNIWVGGGYEREITRFGVDYYPVGEGDLAG